jgi:hypothetical protein
MNETEAIDFIFTAFVQENKELAERAGMSEEDFDAQMAQSEQSLRYIFGNVYNKMKEANLLA